jgi:hypothetical protein
MLLKDLFNKFKKWLAYKPEDVQLSGPPDPDEFTAREMPTPKDDITSIGSIKIKF